MSENEVHKTMPKLDLAKLRQLSNAASSGPYTTHFSGSTHTIEGVVRGEAGHTPVAGDIAERSDAELIEHLLTHREQIIDTLIAAACLAGTLRGKRWRRTGRVGCGRLGSI